VTGALVCALSARSARATEPVVRLTNPPAELEPASWVVPSLHALGLMTVMRSTEAYLWPEPFAETGLFQVGRRYYEAFSRAPVWHSSRPLFEEDGDHWQVNVIGHGLFGSELYLRARTCHEPAWQALLFTALASASWEYVFEASGTRPSALDLTFTPVAGLLLGEARFWGWSAAHRLRSRALRSTLSVLFDPLGELERAAGTPC
jgi:hypothetical protein